MTWLDWSAKLQSWCKHIHISMIRCFLNSWFLTAVIFVIERRACSIYLHIHKSKRRSQQLRRYFHLLFTPKRRMNRTMCILGPLIIWQQLLLSSTQGKILKCHIKLTSYCIVCWSQVISIIFMQLSCHFWRSAQWNNTSWRWVNNDRNVLFEWSIPLILSNLHFRHNKTSYFMFLLWK